MSCRLCFALPVSCKPALMCAQLGLTGAETLAGGESCEGVQGSAPRTQKMNSRAACGIL